MANDSFYAAFRTSHKVYKSRPPANCKAARYAWDAHSADGAKQGKGKVVWMRLLDGYWGAEFENGDLDEIENV